MKDSECNVTVTTCQRGLEELNECSAYPVVQSTFWSVADLETRLPNRFSDVEIDNWVV